MKLICDFSFVSDYVEKFYLEDRRSASIIDSAISPFLEGDPILVISYDTIKELRELYSDRKLVLDSVFGLCEKSDVSLKDRIESLIKITAIYEVQDPDTYVLADDDYIINIIKKTTTHKAISIDDAITLLRVKGLLVKRSSISTETPS